MSCKHLTITPINKSLKSKSNIDFREQWMRTRTGELNWCWDDSKYNKAKKGEYFAYLFYGNKVILHKIVAVKPPSERLPSWSSNVGQGDRNVLELSEPLKEFTWNEWTENDGPLSHLGTYTTGDLSESRPKLFNLLNEIIQKVTQNQTRQQDIDLIEQQIENQNRDFQRQIELIQKQMLIQTQVLKQQIDNIRRDLI